MGSAAEPADCDAAIGFGSRPFTPLVVAGALASMVRLFVRAPSKEKARGPEIAVLVCIHFSLRA